MNVEGESTSLRRASITTAFKVSRSICHRHPSPEKRFEARSKELPTRKVELYQERTLRCSKSRNQNAARPFAKPARARDKLRASLIALCLFDSHTQHWRGEAKRGRNAKKKNAQSKYISRSRTFVSAFSKFCIEAQSTVDPMRKLRNARDLRRLLKVKHSSWSPRKAKTSLEPRLA